MREIQRFIAALLIASLSLDPVVAGPVTRVFISPRNHSDQIRFDLEAVSPPAALARRAVQERSSKGRIYITDIYNALIARHQKVSRETIVDMARYGKIGAHKERIPGSQRYFYEFAAEKLDAILAQIQGILSERRSKQQTQKAAKKKPHSHHHPRKKPIPLGLLDENDSMPEVLPGDDLLNQDRPTWSGTYIGTVDSYNPNAQPLKLNGQPLSFPQALKPLPTFLFDKDPDAIAVHWENGEFLTPDSLTDNQRDAVNKLEEALSKLPQQRQPVVFLLFSGAFKTQRYPHLGNSETALLSDTHGNSVWLNPDAGDDPKDPLATIEATQEFVRTVNPKALPSLLQDQISVAVQMAEGAKPIGAMALSRHDQIAKILKALGNKTTLLAVLAFTASITWWMVVSQFHHAVPHTSSPAATHTFGIMAATLLMGLMGKVWGGGHSERVEEYTPAEREDLNAAFLEIFSENGYELEPEPPLGGVYHINASKGSRTVDVTIDAGELTIQWQFPSVLARAHLKKESSRFIFNDQALPDYIGKMPLLKLRPTPGHEISYVMDVPFWNWFQPIAAANPNLVPAEIRNLFEVDNLFNVNQRVALQFDLSKRFSHSKSWKGKTASGENKFELSLPYPWANRLLSIDDLSLSVHANRRRLDSRILFEANATSVALFKPGHEEPTHLERHGGRGFLALAMDAKGHLVTIVRQAFALFYRELLGMAKFRASQPIKVISEMKAFKDGSGLTLVEEPFPQYRAEDILDHLISELGKDGYRVTPKSLEGDDFWLQATGAPNRDPLEFRLSKQTLEYDVHRPGFEFQSTWGHSRTTLKVNGQVLDDFEGPCPFAGLIRQSHIKIVVHDGYFERLLEKLSNSPALGTVSELLLRSSDADYLRKDPAKLAAAVLKRATNPLTGVYDEVTIGGWSSNGDWARIAHDESGETDEWLEYLEEHPQSLVIPPGIKSVEVRVIKAHTLDRSEPRASLLSDGSALILISEEALPGVSDRARDRFAQTLSQALKAVLPKEVKKETLSAQRRRLATGS